MQTQSRAVTYIGYSDENSPDYKSSQFKRKMNVLMVLFRVQVCSPVPLQENAAAAFI